MQRFHQVLFVVSLAALCWLGMQAIHELGHVLGAIITGGTIQHIVLQPLMFSRTDVSPNPHPSIVVWLGPLMGVLLPLAAWLLIPTRARLAKQCCKFFAGFCLIANGSYIGLGAFDGVGDAGVMLSTGAPMWSLFAFGAVTATFGLWLWHQMGSLREFLGDPSLVELSHAYYLSALLLVIACVEMALSPS